MTKEAEKMGLVRIIRFFFPLHLLFYHLKHNILGLIYWSVLFLIVGNSMGYYFGIPILFFSPEYLDEVSVWSFYLLGIGIGGFIMAFNTYSYIKLGPYYPFLITVHRPFFKFCKNNSIIPMLFIIAYLYNMWHFQQTQEFASNTEILWFGLFFLGGIASFLLTSLIYFFPLSRAAQVEEPKASNDEAEQPVETAFHKEGKKWYNEYQHEKDRIYFYFGKGIQIKRSRSIRHIRREVIEKMFARNKINTSIFEILTITAYIVLGLFSEIELFEMPAGMSIILLMTIILMLFSAMLSWFGQWTYPILIAVLFGMNHLSLTTHLFTFKNQAYGLNYSPKEARAIYSINEIEHVANSDEKDRINYNNYLNTLENWKKQTGQNRPKLIIVNTSGGGSRSALWTLGTLQKIDKSLNGELTKSLHLITGASGGMLGAAYFRELQLRHSLGEIDNLYAKKYQDNIGKDLLNKLTFAASTNDIFFRYQKFEYNNMKYSKDRGYAFEEQLNENTDSIMEHPLGYYTKYEKQGMIPTMIFSPTIINDGRRMLISSQPLNFLTESHGGPTRMSKSYENIDFLTFFEGHSPENIRFISVIRSNATFPFVMPMITLPTNPEIQLMDAGIRDNYGGKIMMQFLQVMKEWIYENTSGIIIIQIRDTKKILDNESYQQVSMLDKVTLPFGNIYKNFPRTQDFNQEELLKIGTQQFRFPVDLVSFNLREREKDKIALSWHLTTQEKKKIDDAFQSNLNQSSLIQLKRLLNFKESPDI